MDVTQHWGWWWINHSRCGGAIGMKDRESWERWGSCWESDGKWIQREEAAVWRWTQPPGASVWNDCRRAFSLLPYKWQHTVQLGSGATGEVHIRTFGGFLVEVLSSAHRSLTCSSGTFWAAPMEVCGREALLMAGWVCVKLLCDSQVEGLWQSEGWKGICAAHSHASGCMQPIRQVESRDK